MANTSRNILITGAGSGLGRGIAIHLAASHRLLLTDVSTDALAESARLIREQHPSAAVQTSSLDVTDPAQIDRLASDHADVNIVINNAGLQHVARLEDFPIERWRQLIDVMLTGPFLLMRAFLPSMRAGGYGRIINIGSIHSLVASPFKSAYTAAKHGLLGLSKVVALETADAPITVNTICPSYVRTPLVEQQIRAQSRQHGIPEADVINKIMLEPMPKKCFIEFDEIAATIEFLLSDAARNITGQSIPIEGGWTAR